MGLVELPSGLISDVEQPKLKTTDSPIPKEKIANGS
jgi:hypothetical protein